MYDEDPRDSEQDYYKRGEYDALRSPLVTALLDAVDLALTNLSPLSQAYQELEAAAEALRKEREE